MATQTIADVPVGVAEIKAYLRVEGGEEDALLAGLARSATALCEAFTRMALVARDVVEVAAASGEWRRLEQAPVTAVTGVERLLVDGSAVVLAAGGFEAEIDAQGSARVRVFDLAATRVRVTYRAGIAEDWNGVPEPLRQGIVRLVAHLFAHRDGVADGALPAAVAALWRPWRRMRLV